MGHHIQRLGIAHPKLAILLITWGQELAGHVDIQNSKVKETLRLISGFVWPSGCSWILLAAVICLQVLTLLIVLPLLRHNAVVPWLLLVPGC